MRVKESFEYILVELNKVQAPSLLLDDFIYLFNKGIQEYYNERYNLFETKQQLTDDLRVLVKSVKIDMSKTQSSKGIYGNDYKCELPSDYVHILNCVCAFKSNVANKCSDSDTLYQGANKINSNQWPHIINNYYLKPSVRNPYYYIMNVDDPSFVTDPTNGRSSKEEKQESAEQGEYVRYGNTVQPVMRVVFGNTNKYSLEYVFIDYLRAPIYYSLSEDELDSIADNSLVIEFPDYVVYEIINRIVRLILENGSNPRIQTHSAVNQSIV